MLKFIFLQVLTYLMLSDGQSWPADLNEKWPQSGLYSKYLYEGKIQRVPDETIEEFIQKSNDFPIKFPVNYTRTATLKTDSNNGALKDYINSAYPLLHEKALQLFVGWIDQKQRFGNNLERSFYENFTILELVERLLTKRAVTFYGTNDWYLLRDGLTGKDDWDKIGTPDETAPLILENYLSYDEIKLSALLSVSSKSYFLDNKNKIKSCGIVIGAVGPRLDKELVMEYREIIKTPTQNTHLYGYGTFFVPTLQGIVLNFYGVSSQTYEELIWTEQLKNTTRYIKLAENKYFDRELYKKRIALVIDVLLIESNHRGKQENKKVSLNLVKFGEGSVTPEEHLLILQTLQERLFFLPNLDYLNEICLSPDFILQNNIIIKKNSSEITIKQQDNCTSLNNTLKVITYNWNGNAIPGNEFWLNHNIAPNEATFTQILELQNPFINKKVSASNLHVVSIKDGIVTFEDYLKLHKND